MDITDKLISIYKNETEMLKQEIAEARQNGDFEMVRDLREELREHQSRGDEPLFKDELPPKHGQGDRLI